MLTVRLGAAAATLPGDLVLALLVSLAAQPDVRGLARLEDRVDWLAARLNRNARTARQRPAGPVGRDPPRVSELAPGHGYGAP